MSSSDSTVLWCRKTSRFVGKRCPLTRHSWLFLKSEKLRVRKLIESKPNFGPIMVLSHFFFVLFTALRSRVHDACQTPVYKRCWPLPRLCIVAQSVCDFHGKNLEVQSRGLDRIQLGSIRVADDVILFCLISFGPKFAVDTENCEVLCRKRGVVLFTLRALFLCDVNSSSADICAGPSINVELWSRWMFQPPRHDL